jgi:glycerophosphoryl diester phosphodiesterase
MPEHRCLILEVIEEPTMAQAEELINICLKHKFDGVDVYFKNSITSEFVSLFHEKNLDVYTWTVDDLQIAKKQKTAGVDAITSNCAAFVSSNL